MAKTPYVVTISSEKGGVGKTTLALNLAIYAKYIFQELHNQDIPVTIFSFDNHFSVDRMLQIGRNTGGHNIGDVLTGKAPFEDAVKLGQYGVSYIPSHDRLSELRTAISSPEMLSRAISRYTDPGLIIIDTRPDLDTLTQNAIYAADRVLIPVKDEASLSNSKFLYDFASQNEIPKESLMVLPSLLDSRIRFDGAFQTPYQLIRAYAKHRGYPCFDGFISKSPKVETLNTNPEGRIYPILKYGRMTEVHIQLTDLAKAVASDFFATSIRRNDLIRIQGDNRRAKLKHQFNDRLKRVDRKCPVCGEDLDTSQRTEFERLMVYGTSSGYLGFVHESCAVSSMVSGVFNSSRKEDVSPDFLEMTVETLRNSFYGFTATGSDSSSLIVDVCRFNEDGFEISRKPAQVKIFDSLIGRKETPMARLLSLLMGDNPAEIFFLLPASTETPDGILYGEHFMELSASAGKIVSQMSSDANQNSTTAI